MIRHWTNGRKCLVIDMTGLVKVMMVTCGMLAVGAGVMGWWDCAFLIVAFMVGCRVAVWRIDQDNVPVDWEGWFYEEDRH